MNNPEDWGGFYSHDSVIENDTVDFRRGRLSKQASPIHRNYLNLASKIRDRESQRLETPGDLMGCSQLLA
jgi:hypothetical protein